MNPTAPLPPPLTPAPGATAAPVTTGGNYDQLRSALLGGVQAGSAPSYQTEFPEIANLYAPAAAASASSAALGSHAARQSVVDQNAKAKAAQDAAMLDGSKYQQIPKKDGGYAFIAPNGQEVSAYDYSRVTGKPLDSLLGDSKNPIDIGFVQDYKNLNDYLQAKVNSKVDDTSRQMASDIENEVKSTYGVDLSKENIQDVINRFKAAYPTVYGGHVAGQQAGSTLFPVSNNAGDGSTTDSLSNINTGP